MRIRCKHCGVVNKAREALCHHCAQSLQDVIKTEIMSIYPQANNVILFFPEVDDESYDESRSLLNKGLRLLLVGSGASLLMVFLLKLLLPVIYQ